MGNRRGREIRRTKSDDDGDGVRERKEGVERKGEREVKGVGK